MYIHTYIQSYNHTNIHTYNHTIIQSYKHTNIQTHIHTYIQTYKHTYKHTNIQTYKHTNIQTHIHTNIHTFKHTNIHTVSRHHSCKCSLQAIHSWVLGFSQDAFLVDFQRSALGPLGLTPAHLTGEVYLQELSSMLPAAAPWRKLLERYG